MNNPKMMLDQDTLFYAFRYALGRKTGVVNDMDEKIRAHIHEMTSQSIVQMVGEITRAAELGRLGDECDIRTWLELRLYLYEYLGKLPHE